MSNKKHTNTIDLHPSLCICSVFIPVIVIARFWGVMPVTWEHQNGKCIFKKSYPWLLYSVLIMGLFVFQVVNSIDFLNLGKVKSLPILLSNVTDAIYGLYIVFFSFLHLFRFPRWINVLNRMKIVENDGIFCNSARRVVLLTEYGYTGFITIVFILYSSLIIFLHFSENYKTNFDYNFFINKILQNLTGLFYLVFCSLVSVFMGILACFEKLTISCLKYTPVHPMKGINESNNLREDFFGLFTYKLCNEEHLCIGKLLKLSQTEIIEFLRILHEEISLLMYELNDAMNPQFLCHTVVELTVLIVQWYAVVVYFAFEFKAPIASAIHVLNCCFVILHTLGVYIFLKNAQQLKNMIHNLNNFLLEYSTRITSPEEHQQVRIFIEKLKQHRPLTASGVFDIDLSIAGPISANILTYVLVALQFEIPKEE